MIETLRPIDGGTATIDGIDVAEHPYEIRGMIGVQPQTPGFQDKTKLTELIQMFAAAYGVKVDPKKFLDEVNLATRPIRISKTSPAARNNASVSRPPWSMTPKYFS